MSNENTSHTFGSLGSSTSGSTTSSSVNVFGYKESVRGSLSVEDSSDENISSDFDFEGDIEKEAEHRNKYKQMRDTILKTLLPESDAKLLKSDKEKKRQEENWKRIHSLLSKDNKKHKEDDRDLSEDEKDDGDESYYERKIEEKLDLKNRLMKMNNLLARESDLLDSIIKEEEGELGICPEAALLKEETENIRDHEFDLQELSEPSTDAEKNRIPWWDEEEESDEEEDQKELDIEMEAISIMGEEEENELENGSQASLLRLNLESQDIRADKIDEELIERALKEITMMEEVKEEPPKCEPVELYMKKLLAERKFLSKDNALYNKFKTMLILSTRSDLWVDKKLAKLKKIKAKDLIPLYEKIPPGRKEMLHLFYLILLKKQKIKSHQREIQNLEKIRDEMKVKVFDLIKSNQDMKSTIKFLLNKRNPIKKRIDKKLDAIVSHEKVLKLLRIKQDEMKIKYTHFLDIKNETLCMVDQCEELKKKSEDADATIAALEAAIEVQNKMSGEIEDSSRLDVECDNLQTLIREGVAVLDDALAAQTLPNDELSVKKSKRHNLVKFLLELMNFGTDGELKWASPFEDIVTNKLCLNKDED